MWSEYILYGIKRHRIIYIADKAFVMGGDSFFILLHASRATCIYIFPQFLSYIHQLTCTPSLLFFLYLYVSISFLLNTHLISLTATITYTYILLLLPLTAYQPAKINIICCINLLGGVAFLEVKDFDFESHQHC